MRFISTTFCLTALMFLDYTFAAAEVLTDKDIPRFKQVSDDLYRGGRPTTKGDLEDLRRRGVRVIINLENRPSNVARERRWADELGMDFVNPVMSVHERPTDSAVNRALAAMRGSAFVHCMHGKDRTGLVIALHRVEEEGWDAREAYREMVRNGFDERWVKLVEYYHDRTGR